MQRITSQVWLRGTLPVQAANGRNLPEHSRDRRLPQHLSLQADLLLTVIKGLFRSRKPSGV